jgi:hypothetical protein
MEEFGVFFMEIWSILQTFGVTYGHFVYMLVIWYISPCLVSIGEYLATLKHTRPLSPRHSDTWLTTPRRRPFHFADISSERLEKKLHSFRRKMLQFNFGAAIGWAKIGDYATSPGRNLYLHMALQSTSGLPDFSRYNLPKRVKIYQVTTKRTKWP